MNSDDGSDPKADGGTEMASNDWEVDVESSSEGGEQTAAGGDAPDAQAADFQPPTGGSSDEASIDPYQPPESEIDPERGDGGVVRSDVEIFSSGGVGVATLLGGPLAAVGLLTYNFHEVGWEERVAPTLVVGLLACALIFGLGLYLPTGMSGLGLGGLAAAVVLAKKFNGEIREKLSGEPAEKSNWTAAGIGCLSLVGTFVIFFVGGFMYALIVGT